MAKKITPKRGDIWWVNFDPTIGTEIQKTRPAIIISNDISNTHLSRYQVIPVTSQVTNIYPCEALVQIDGQQGKAMSDQIMTISTLRLAGRIGHITNAEMSEIEKVIRLQLGL